MRISLSNKLALLFAAVTFLAICAVYVYVAPGLQQRLIDEKLKGLSSAAHRQSGPIARTVGSADTPRAIQAHVNNAALGAGRVRRRELAAGRVAGGEFERPLPAESTDEIGRAAGGFKRGARRLAQVAGARR